MNWLPNCYLKMFKHVKSLSFRGLTAESTACKCLVVILVLSLSIAAHAEIIIKNYHPVFISGVDQTGKQLIAIRNYQADGVDYFLAVNPNTLQTSLISINQLITKSFTTKQLEQTPYFKLLQKYSQPPYKLQNYGITHVNAEGIALTVDLCPSTKPLEKRLFMALNGPVAISISGRWLQQHQEEFNWLIAQQNLQITWVNHSFTHFYQKNLPLEKNFLLHDPKKLNNEVLENEKLLIANNQTPSIYFRFPGLVSNKQLIKKLTKLGLVPLGADAWLAKGEQPKNGSIILVHGNGNEPLGVDIFLELLAKQKIKYEDLTKLLANF
jgi:hypothetical protein